MSNIYLSELSFYNYCHKVLARFYPGYYRVTISECIFWVYKQDDLELCREFLTELYAMRFKGSHKKYNHELKCIKNKYMS